VERGQVDKAKAELMAAAVRAGMLAASATGPRAAAAARAAIETRWLYGRNSSANTTLEPDFDPTQQELAVAMDKDPDKFDDWLANQVCGDGRGLNNP
jgi:hypothetical protein